MNFQKDLPMALNVIQGNSRQLRCMLGMDISSIWISNFQFDINEVRKCYLLISTS